MGRLTQDFAVVPLFEPIDLAAGADSETFKISHAASVDIIFITGVLTVPGTLSVFSGATAGTKTTAQPFTYKVTGADYKAVAADQFGADTAEADGVLTLSATANDHRTHVLHIDAVDVNEGHNWLTLTLASGTAQLVAAVAILHYVRYQAPDSVVPTS